MNEKQLLDVVGDVPEMGSRVYVFPSLYGVNIGIQGFDLTAANDQTGGFSPYADVVATIIDEGPYEGIDISARVWIGPGRTGRGLGFMAHTCKAITGQAPDVGSFAKFGLAPTDPDARAARKQIVENFYGLDPQARLDWAVAYARIPLWDGKPCVAKIGYEIQEDETEKVVDPVTGEERNAMHAWPRLQGFYAIGDAKFGLAYVKRVCHPKQEEAFKAGYNPLPE